jgi:hypothetical protein
MFIEGAGRDVQLAAIQAASNIKEENAALNL